MKKLSLDDSEALLEVVQLPGLPVLVSVLEAIKQSMASDVIKYNLEAGDERRLAALKYRSEGAEKMLSELERYLESFQRQYDEKR